MPKYDAATLNALTRKIEMYMKACEMSKNVCIHLEEWNNNLEEFHKGMIEGSKIIITIVDEMRHTAIDESDK